MASTKEVLFSLPFICLLAGLHKYYLLELHAKKSEDGSWSNLDPIKLKKSDLDHSLNTKKIIRIFPFTYYY